MAGARVRTRSTPAERWRRPVAAAGACLALLCGGQVRAKTIAMTCEDGFANGAAKMRLVYEGSDSGVLKVSASVGAFTIPATLSSAQDSQIGGEIVTVQGVGTASLKLPPRASLEACEVKHDGGADGNDDTVRVLPGDPCWTALSPSLPPVAVKAQVDLTLFPSGKAGAPPDPGLDEMAFRYPERSEALRGFLQIGAAPSPACTLDQP